MAELYGTHADEHLIGFDTPDIIDGLGGNDILEGLGGNDSLTGGPGFDSVLGGEGDDTLYVGIGADKLNGGPGDDIFQYLDVLEPGGEEIVGGEGTDAIFSAYNLSGEMDFSRTLIGSDVERLVAHSAVALTVEQLNRLSFLQSADLRLTTSGILELRDLDFGTTPPITLADGTNFVDFTGSNFSYMVFGGNGYDTVIAGDNGLNVSGGGGGDTLTGAAGVDHLHGDAGYDWLFGRGGTDGLVGGSGPDLLRGGAGVDSLSCGVGGDNIGGGRDPDQFFFESTPASGATPDRIVDFAPGRDRILLSEFVFAIPDGDLSTAAFHVGSAAHDSTDRIIYDSRTGALMYDPNGNSSGGAVQVATLDTGLALSASDFLVV